MTIKLAHFSDSHLGYEAFPALSAKGNNQRGEDVVRAFTNVISDIQSWDPDLVIHAGDVGERPKVDIRYMLVAQRLFARLTKREDGSRRPVIIIAGNHDLPRSRKEACWLELLSQIPDVFVVCHSYEVIDLGVRGYGEAFKDVVVHALPHDTLKEVDFSLVKPLEEKRNILTVHGVAAGSELFTRSLGREYAIDSDVLARKWEYVALGHFHKRGPVSIGGGLDPRIWYSGSSENISFRDLRENGTERGYLRVTLGEELEVVPVDLPIRRMLRLPVVEGAGLEPAALEATLIERVRHGDIAGAVVGQVVEGVTRDVWSLVDAGKIMSEASDTLHYEITVRCVKAEPGEAATRELGDLAGLLDAEVTRSVSEELRPDVLRMAQTLLGSALAMPEEPDKEASDVDVTGLSGEIAAVAESAVESTPTKAPVKKSPVKKSPVKKSPVEKPVKRVGVAE